ncbi:MAG: HAMP domain-containing protein [Candidatus Rokubacteria bacterium]|nr:HAMP domain-containing protein [Candidatus Rokubacteria bacterium]
MRAVVGPGRLFGAKRGLAFRFNLLVGIALLVVSAASAYLGARAERDTLAGELARQAGRMADLLAASSANALFTFDDHGLDGTVQAFLKDPEVRLLEIRDKAGKVAKSGNWSSDRQGLIVAEREVKAGVETVGTVVLGLSPEPVERAVAGAWRRLLAREAVGLLLLFALLAYLIRREVARPLAELESVLSTAKASGNISARVRWTRADELGRLAQRFNEFMDTLADLLQRFAGASRQVTGASDQVAGAAQVLSTGSQQQASSLEESAASLEEITATVKQNADNARQASQLAGGSRDAAERGGQVVSAAVASMQEITRSSKQIADIITVIDEIAFQTNLLALNAAVEAARAGEQGRGFAVVAAEVRNLAQRSAGAAKEIKALIQDSVAKVEEGSGLVNKSGQTLDEIVQSAKRVADIVAEIAAACQEQSSGIDQVNRAVAQMDRVTQDNAAQSEELSSTSQALAGQAREMLALVDRFILADVSGAVGAEGRPAGRQNYRASPRAHPIPTSSILGTEVATLGSSN